MSFAISYVEVCTNQSFITVQYPSLTQHINNIGPNTGLTKDISIRNGKYKQPRYNP